MKAFLKRLWAVLPVVLVPTFGMLLGSILFGAQHLSIGLGLIFYNAMTIRQPLTKGRFVIDLTTFLCVTVLALVAGRNLLCSIFLNSLVFFLLIVYFSDELTLSGYYVYGLMMLIGQTQFPLTMDLLPGRIGTLLVGMAVVLLYKLYIWHVKPYGWKRGQAELRKNQKTNAGIYVGTRDHLINRLSKESLAVYESLATEADDSEYSLLRSLWMRIRYRWVFHPCYLGFAVKMMVAMTLGFAISHFMGFDKIHWLPFTVYAMVLPSFETTKEKAYTTFYGTLVGAALFLLIFRHVPSSWKIPFMVIIICFVFSLKNEIFRKMVSTQLSLALSGSSLGHAQYAGSRITMVVVAMVIVLVINQISAKYSHPNGIPINAIRIEKINGKVMDILKKPVKTPQNACYRNIMLLETLALEDMIRPYKKTDVPLP